MYNNLIEEFKIANSSVVKARKEEYASESEEDKHGIATLQTNDLIM